MRRAARGAPIEAAPGSAGAHTQPLPPAPSMTHAALGSARPARIYPCPATTTTTISHASAASPRALSALLAAAHGRPVV